MADLSKLSDQEILAMAQGKPSNQPSMDLSKLSDEEILKLAQPQSEKMGMLETAKIKGQEGALLGLRPVVAGTGAALGAAVGTKGSMGTKLDAAIDAFKQGRLEANQEQDLASASNPKIALTANVGGSLLATPFLAAKSLQGISGGIKLGAGLGAARAAGSANSLEDAAWDVAGGAITGGVINAAAPAIGQTAQAITRPIKEGAKNLLTKVSSELTGIPDKEIETYATRADKVKELYQKADNDPSIAAKHLKENVFNDVQRARRELNGQITRALQNSPPDKIIDNAPLIDQLEKAKSQIHPIYGENDIQAIDGIINKINKASENGKLSIKDLQDTKNFLYDSAQGSYNINGNIFPVGKEVSRAAKTAGREAKEILDKIGPTEIKNANRQLQQLHEIEEHMGPNLLNPNARSHSDLFSVGSGNTNNNSAALADLGKITGENYLDEAANVTAGRSFGKARLLPEIKTGRSLLGPIAGGALGGAAGAAVGGVPGAYIGGKIGAGIGAVLSSPAALKTALDAGRISSNVLEYVAKEFGVNPANQGQIYQLLLQNKDAQSLLKRTLGESDKPSITTSIKSKKDLGK